MSNTSTSILERLVAKAAHFYTLPAVAMRVLELTDNPQVDTRALKECIENDPALTTKVLRVVNSSLFGLSREVSDLNQALALLGTKPLKLLVLGFSLPSGLFAGLTGDTLEWYWRHTLTKAIAAREISETVWHQPGDEPFIAGLLQDLGMLLLIQELGAPYAEFLEKVCARTSDLLALEVESIGFDHTELTSRLLAHWRLPDSLVEAVRWENTREAVDSGPLERPTLAEILQLAELIARLLADGKPDVLRVLLVLAEQRHGLSERQLVDLVADLEEKVQQLADVLSLSLPGGLEYRDVLVQSQRQLADVATEAAGELVRQRGLHPSDAEDGFLLDQVQSLSEAMAQMARSSPDSPVANRADRAETEPPSFPPLPTAPGMAPAVEPAPLHPGGKLAVAEADPGLLGHLTKAVIACRQSRCSLSLLLVEWNDLEELVLTRGVEGFSRLRRFLGTACRGVDHPRLTLLLHGEAGFALILPDCDRRAGVQMGNQLIDQVRRMAMISFPDREPTLSVSVGVATVALPPKNFPAKDLLESAERCLYGSHASGGGVVKSIEIY